MLLGSMIFYLFNEVLRKYKEKNPEVNVGKIFAVYDVEGK